MFAASDPMVNLLGIGLVALGVALFVATVAYWRSSVKDDEVLAPLEVMSDRKFARADHHERSDLLEQHRPSGSAVHDDLRPFAVAADDSVDPSAPRWVDNRDRFVRPASTSPEEFESDDDQVEHEVPSDVWRGQAEHVIPNAMEDDEAYEEVDAAEADYDDDYAHGDDGDHDEYDESGQAAPAFIDPLMNLQNQKRRD